MASILVTGGSGYLGQFVVARLSEHHKVAFTYLSHPPAVLPRGAGVKGFKVDLTTGDGLSHCFTELRDISCVVNCAAMSMPAACEKQPEQARSVNVPSALLEALRSHKAQTGQDPLLLHLSTDQVYDGTRALWNEDDECKPVNVYGRTKLEAEMAIQTQWPNHVILRSSIIYGNQSPSPVPRPLMLDFILSSLQSGKPTKFIEDEFRCPIFVEDVIVVIKRLIQRGPGRHKLLNMGGPERMSRMDMALQVANHFNIPTDNIIRVKSAAFDRPVKSPLDISMNVDRLVSELGVRLTTFRDALSTIFPQ